MYLTHLSGIYLNIKKIRKVVVVNNGKYFSFERGPIIMRLFLDSTLQPGYGF
jgi:hypothetical protein